MSSIVTSPAVPPYSSLTMAMCVRLALKSRSCRSIGFEIGMNCAARTSVCQPSIGSSSSMMNGSRSFAYRMPMMLSSVSSNTGKRACSELRTRSTTSLHGVRELDADDVDARHHDLAHHRVAEREDAVQQRLLVARDVRLRGDDLAELLGRLLALLGALGRRWRRQESLEQRVERDAGAQHGREHDLQRASRAARARRARRGAVAKPIARAMPSTSITVASARDDIASDARARRRRR